MANMLGYTNNRLISEENMTRMQIRLDTLTDTNRFVAVMNKINEQIWLEDGGSSIVNAKSMMGVLCSLEFTRIYYC